jgi:FtsP/CotA-like multicopper oxidase with cupredoxin domain
MKLISRIFLTCFTSLICLPVCAEITNASLLLNSICARPNPGAVIQNPPETKSVGGLLSTTLVAHNIGLGPEDPSNNYDYRFCLLEHDEPQRSSPVLRVKPGDRVQLTLKDKLEFQEGFPTPHVHAMNSCIPNQNLEYGNIASLNLHFHGLNIPPTCGSDDVLTTIIQPKDGTPQNISSFTYDFTIPSNDPPGLFWFHPHIHGISQQQLLGGMTGVMVVEGMEEFFPEIKSMRERIFVLRDLDKPNPADNPDAPADEPWKNVSINSVPVIYGSNVTPKLEMGAGERQFWRVANASADTHLVLQFQFNPTGKPEGWQAQNMELIAQDGIPFIADHGRAQGKRIKVTQIVLPPAGRAEFIVTAPSSGVAARFYSADYNDYLSQKSAGCAPAFPDSVCDNTDRNPSRTLASIVTSPATISHQKPIEEPIIEPTGQLHRFVKLAGHAVDKHRTLIFTKDPGDDGNFFITVGGNLPKPFDMTAPPDVTVQGPAVEEWTIENRDNESHDFHIHQIHFRVMAVNGTPTDENTEHVLRDTIELGACRKWADGIDPQNDPYGLTYPLMSPLNDQNFTGKNCIQPTTVKLRMDFRDRNIVGTFLYHCHILEHEDHGMMAKIKLN